MLKVLLVLLVMQSNSPIGSPNADVKFRERILGPTPVTDKDLRPVKAPDCRNEAEIQQALEQLSYGEPGDCFIRDIRRLDRRAS